MNKKAIMAYDVSMWIIKIILLGIIISFVMFVIYMLVVNDIGVERLRTELFVERMVSSSDCLAHIDVETGRVYPDSIDSANFKEDKIQNCMKYAKIVNAETKKFIAAKITLTYFDKPLKQDENPLEKYYEMELYDKWLPFSLDPRYYLRAKRDRYVFVYENGQQLKGKLSFDIVTPTG